ncbi:AraC family transcriptional regulator [Paenibacillus sp. GCM10023252]|uniref:helix-turn-helix transcriptional regulator n=1 Tax=Paenibacillus sp. GCM10023252 TaxID=3252649 RepID=UPI0036184BCD
MSQSHSHSHSQLEPTRKPIEAMYNTSQIPTDFHSHLQYEIYYFHSGKCNYLIGDRIFELKPGDLILMNGMTLHCPRVDTREEYCRTIVHFEPSFVEGLLGPPFKLPLLAPFETHMNQRLSLSEEDRAQIEPLLERMCLLHSRHDALSHDRLVAGLLELLMLIYEIADKPQSSSGAQPGVKQQNVQALISYIEEHYREELTLEDLAQHMHLNKHYIVKIFKETTGITLFHYLYQRRVNQAKVLFTMNPDLTITEAAYEVGFKYISHFSQTFKKHTGRSPDEYRRELRQSYDKSTGRIRP